MKKYFFIISVFIFAAAFAACSKSANVASASSVPAGPAAAEISFNFLRQSGAASNQFAVWIEDAGGNFVKTLYATRYTANGGWKVRESSIPVWVQKSSLANMEKAQIDVITSPTPGNGELLYSWDGTNNENTPVPNGNYTIFLEATLRWENQALFSAPVILGEGSSSPEVNVLYSGTPPGDERNMISSVAVRVYR